MTQLKKNPGKIETLVKSQDAVAEVMDFITIIGILLLSFSIIGVAGYPVLRNAQEAGYVESTRQSFIVMADSINKIAVGQAPSKSIEMKLYGGRLSVTRESTIEINATRYNSSSPSGYDNLTLVDETELGNIQNSIGDVVVTYEGTGAWIKYPNGKVINIYKPLIYNQSNMLIIPVVRISGNYSVGGTGMSRISSEGEPRVTYWGNVNNITITITGDYVSGWSDYFENTLNWYVDSGNTYTAKLNSTTNLNVYILDTDMQTVIE